MVKILAVRTIFSRVFVIGDTHGKLDFEKLKIFKKEVSLKSNDLIIIAGDGGIIWDSDSMDEYIKLYESIGCTIAYLDGNHENFDMLEQYPIRMWNGGKIHRITSKIIHLMRGQIYAISTKKRVIKIATMGGGDSRDKDRRIDYEYRTGKKIWWTQEAITEADIEEMKRNVAIHGNEVDYFISHCPSATVKKLNGLKCTDSDFMVRRTINEAKIKAKMFISGHEHFDYETEFNGRQYAILWRNIFELY